MKHYFIIFILLSSSNLFANEIKVESPMQRVVLLTSLSEPKKTFWNKFFNFNSYISNIEKSFRKRFEAKPYEVEIIRDADQFDLSNALTNPRNVAVFWMSHGSYSKKDGSMMKVAQIVDAKGYDVTPLFEKIHPNLRFLAVIGCYSEGVLGSAPSFSLNRRKAENSLLKVFTFNKKVEAKKGLKSAIAESIRVLDDPAVKSGYHPPCVKVPGLHFRVTRSFDYSKNWQKKFDISPIRPAARIVAGSKILAVFPSDEQQATQQEMDIFIPSVSSKDLPKRVNIDAGTNYYLQNKNYTPLVDLGRLTFALVNREKEKVFTELWSLLTLRSGLPLGIFTNIYKVVPNWSEQLETSFESAWSEEPEFACETMPNI